MGRFYLGAAALFPFVGSGFGVVMVLPEKPPLDPNMNRKIASIPLKVKAILQTGSIFSVFSLPILYKRSLNYGYCSIPPDFWIFALCHHMAVISGTRASTAAAIPITK